MDIHMSGCLFPAQFSKKELIEKIKSYIKRYIDIYVRDSNRKNPVPGPKVKLMLDKFDAPFIVLEFDTTELGLRLDDSREYVEKTLFAITLNKDGSDVLEAGTINGSISTTKRDIMSIYVTKDDKKGSYQDLGIGKALILMFEDLAQKEQPDVEYTTLGAEIDKEGKNINFCKNLGFYPVSVPHNNSLPMAKGIQKEFENSTLPELSGYYMLQAAAEFRDRLNHQTTSEKIFWNSIVRSLQSYADAAFEAKTKMIITLYEHKSKI